MTLPAGNSTPLHPVLGISDFGPFPSNMTSRNMFRGPGAWNFDTAVTKQFTLKERLRLEFRAEGFDIFNHHNYYVNLTPLILLKARSPSPHSKAVSAPTTSAE
jgi:hypothetical protein